MNIQCAHHELTPLHKLQPNPKNPNKHPDNQIEVLAKIIDYQGQRAPIVVSKRSGFITKGHGRLAAIQKLGWKECAVDYQDYESEAQEYADMVADNKIAELAQTDMGMVNHEIEELEIEEVELLGIVDDEWSSDINSLDRINETDKGPRGIIKIICESEDKEALLEFIRDALKKADKMFGDIEYE